MRKKAVRIEIEWDDGSKSTAEGGHAAQIMGWYHACEFEAIYHGMKFEGEPMKQEKSGDNSSL